MTLVVIALFGGSHDRFPQDGKVKTNWVLL